MKFTYTPTSPWDLPAYLTGWGGGKGVNSFTYNDRGFEKQDGGGGALSIRRDGVFYTLLLTYLLP